MVKAGREAFDVDKSGLQRRFELGDLLVLRWNKIQQRVLVVAVSKFTGSEEHHLAFYKKQYIRTI
jgi:hypothetical protein